MHSNTALGHGRVALLLRVIAEGLPIRPRMAYDPRLEVALYKSLIESGSQVRQAAIADEISRPRKGLGIRSPLLGCGALNRHLYSALIH